MSVLMLSPGGLGAFTLSSGNSYTPSAAGYVNAIASDVGTLLGMDFTVVSGPAAFSLNPRNLIDGGNFSTNPFQRNVPGLASGGVISTAISNAVTYFADRFFAVGGASSAILMAAVADASVQGFTQSLKISRQAANANTAAINFGQVIGSADSARAQGQQVTVSFYAKQGANYSGGPLAVSVITGTGTNQSAASMVAASWPGQSSSVSGSASLTTSMTRYSFTGNIPAAATQIGLLLSWTPTGTAGSDDSVSINGVQLEIGASASAFEFLSAQLVLELCQRYACVIPEPASGVVVASGMNTGSSAQIFAVPLPNPVYKAPTVTIAAGSFKTNQAGTATSTTISAGATHTPNTLTIDANSSGTAGQATLLIGGGGSGYILASADF